ncbi:MAG: amino acid ABC transporter ATP-binding protein [Campylobacter sp.]|nr:amino acid ABC transporter ATP-binding protein [Campylobacter sp.]
MLKIEKLCKKFKNEEILKNINLEVKTNEIIAIIGPSGAGKSTFLRTMNLLEIADSGKISIDELKIDFENFNKDEILKFRRKSAMVFQNFNLFINKNILENITEALIVVYKMPKNSAKELAYERLKSVNLESKALNYPYELSGGQQQRVAIARALALNPSLMLFDEPTSALDLELVAEVLEVIKNIKDKTMIIVTHKLKFAKNIADRIIFMANGEILEQGEAQNFFDNATHSRVKSFLEKLNI